MQPKLAQTTQNQVLLILLLSLLILLLIIFIIFIILFINLQAFSVRYIFRSCEWSRMWFDIQYNDKMCDGKSVPSLIIVK